MPGIFGTNKTNLENIMEQKNRIFMSLNNNEWHLELSSIKKFENDKTLYDDDNYTILIDGVILNLTSLKNEYNETKLEKLLIQMYKKNGEKFFNLFRGNFCGFFKDKVNNKILIFTNHTGEKTIFYYYENNEIIFASEIKHIINFMKKHSMKYNIDERGIYSILTYGYMYDNLTNIKEIKRLLPGEYLKIQDGKLEELIYYRISNNVKDTRENEEQIINNIEEKFKQAVKLQVDKNKEYGYENVAPLSAGLDSRMTNYMIKKIINKPIINITYSQTNQLDEKIPSKIASELKNHWLFKNLDNGLALYNIDESLKFSDGILYYLWPSQLYDYIQLLNTDNVGIIHTGVIGDVIIGTFLKNPSKRNYLIGDGAYSIKLIKKLEAIIDIRKYENYEIGMLYNRAFNGAVLGYSMVFQYYTEAMSPFMNVDFMDYCLSLPLEYRKGHNIYYKWVRKYHSEAAKYSHNGKKIPKGNSIKITIKGKKYALISLPSMIKNKLIIKIRKNNDMNPVQYWYETNNELKEKMDKYYTDNINLMDKFTELKKDMINLYNTGNAMEKAQVITILSFMKKYFMES